MDSCFIVLRMFIRFPLLFQIQICLVWLCPCHYWQHRSQESEPQLFWVPLKLAGKKVVKLWLSRMCTGLFPCFSVSNNSPLPVVEAAWKGVRDEGLWSSHFPALRHVSSTSSDVLFLTRAQSGTSTGEGRQDQRCSS